MIIVKPFGYSKLPWNVKRNCNTIIGMCALKQFIFFGKFVTFFTVSRYVEVLEDVFILKGQSC